MSDNDQLLVMMQQILSQNNNIHSLLNTVNTDMAGMKIQNEWLTKRVEEGMQRIDHNDTRQVVLEKEINYIKLELAKEAGEKAGKKPVSNLLWGIPKDIITILIAGMLGLLIVKKAG